MLTTHEINELRKRAQAVIANEPGGNRLSPRATARCLSGIVRLAATKHGTDTMRRSCANLVADPHAWWPLEADPTEVGKATQMIVTAASGLLSLAGMDGMRAALAFWASETDPAEWQRVTGQAA